MKKKRVSVHSRREKQQVTDSGQLSAPCGGKGGGGEGLKQIKKLD